MDELVVSRYFCDKFELVDKWQSCKEATEGIKSINSGIEGNLAEFNNLTDAVESKCSKMKSYNLEPNFLELTRFEIENCFNKSKAMPPICFSEKYGGVQKNDSKQEHEKTITHLNNNLVVKHESIYFSNLSKRSNSILKPKRLRIGIIEKNQNSNNYHKGEVNVEETSETAGQIEIKVLTDSKMNNQYWLNKTDIFNINFDFETEYFRNISTFQTNCANSNEMKGYLEVTQWVPPRSPHNLIEEVLYHDPWALLAATVFLNKTSCMLARPFIFWFLVENPDPTSVTNLFPKDLEKYFYSLGLKNTRSVQIWRMTYDYLYKDWKKPTDLYGIGNYGNCAYSMFCLGDFSVDPKDRFLKIYKEWYQKIIKPTINF